MTLKYAARVCRAATGCVVSHIEFVPDPHVRGTFAIQADLGGLGRCEFLLRGCPFKSVRDAADALESVVFKSWPPTAGGQR